jgi:hypothetical protein
MENHSRPTFICNFVDGQKTRMTVHCEKGLDVARGVKLARYAYESRTGKKPPEIVSGQFVSTEGEKLMAYIGDELNGVVCHLKDRRQNNGTQS